MSLKYKTHLAEYYANLALKDKLKGKLQLRVIRYLQRTRLGKSPFISTRKALNKWRKEMEEKYRDQ